MEVNWNIRGIFPTNAAERTTFYGNWGMSSPTGNPIPAVVITPESVNVETYSDFSLEAHATNTVACKWQSSPDGITWTDIAGETKLTYSVFVPHEAGKAGITYYRAICQGWLGTTPSQAVKVVVTYRVPTIAITADKSGILYPPETVTLTAEYTFSTGRQWYHSTKSGEWAVLEGETGDTLIVEYTEDNTGLHDYKCVASGLGDSSESNILSVDVRHNPPSVEVTANTTEIITGDTVTLTASATYTESYQWYHSIDGITWEDIPNATTDTLELTYTEEDTGLHYYHCRVEGLGGESESNDVIIEVLHHPPTVTIAADSIFLIAPATVTLTASATYTDVYQWYQSTNGTNWTLIEDEIESTLSVTYATSDAGEHYYKCHVIGIGGEADSDVAIITVSA